MGLQIDKKEIEFRNKIIREIADFSKTKSLTDGRFSEQDYCCADLKFTQGKIGYEGIDVSRKPTLKIRVISNCQFIDCVFTGIAFEDCTFLLCDFLSCTINNISFIRCNFIPSASPESSLDTLKGKPQICSTKYGCYFENTSFLDVCFDECNMQGTVFFDDTLVGVNINKTAITNSIFYECTLKCQIGDSSLYGTSFFETRYFAISFDKSVFDRNTIFHCAIQKSENSIPCAIVKNNSILTTMYTIDKSDFREYYSTLSFTYSQISEIFRMVGLADLYGEYYYLAKKYEQKSLSGIAGATSLLIDFLCGYGERPSHTFYFILGNILLFGLFYLFSGFSIGDNMISFLALSNEEQNIYNFFILFFHSIFFSVTTFSTVGYGNYVPVGGISSALAAIQMLMGVSLTALWTGCIFRKISR